MSKPTPSQEKILRAAAKNPDCDIRDSMTHIKIRSVSEKVFQALLQNDWIAENEASAFCITNAGYAAIGITMPDATKENPRAETDESAHKRKPKAKREGGSKKQTMIDMLLRDEGATIKQLMDTIGWQKHSVHGAMANLKKELHEKHGQTITGSKSDGDDRIYKIA